MADLEKSVISTHGAGAYQQALNKLEKDYKESFGYTKQRQIFETFTRKFTTIPEIWNKWFELEADYNRKHHVDELRKQALTHFYSLDFIGFLRPDTTIVKDFSKLIEWPYLDILRYKCYHINPEVLAEGLKLAEKALTFPHWKLEEIYRIYSSKQEVSEAVKKNYIYSTFLMNLLNISEGEDGKWFKFLKMGRNVEFITQNIEYKICKHPWNVRLWQLYIEYLKETNNPNLLNVYSRFCRFFVDADDIAVEYRIEIQKMHDSGHNVSKWCIDTIEFELDFGTPSVAKKLLERALNSKTCELELLNYALTFGKKYGLCLNSTNIETMISNHPKESTSQMNENRNEAESEEDEEDFSLISTFYKPWGQRFSIPNTVIFHVLKNADYHLLSKLFGTCKALFAKFKVFLCHGLIIDRFAVRGYSPSGSSMGLSLNHLFNFYITNNLTISVSNNPNLLPWLRATLYQCDVEVLNISGQSVDLNIFKFFVGENVSNVSLQNCNITVNEKGDRLAAHDLVALFPKADRIKFGYGTFCTPDTAEKLAALERTTKLKFFSISGAPNTFDRSSFSLFIKNNAAPLSSFSVYFDEETTELQKQDFLFFVKNEIHSSFKEEPPKINVF